MLESVVPMGKETVSPTMFAWSPGSVMEIVPLTSHSKFTLLE